MLAKMLFWIFRNVALGTFGFRRGALQRETGKIAPPTKLTPRDTAANRRQRRIIPAPWMRKRTVA
jgi:hypothetical protein